LSSGLGDEYKGQELMRRFGKSIGMAAISEVIHSNFFYILHTGILNEF